jgi:hypothetical protein
VGEKVKGKEHPETLHTPGCSLLGYKNCAYLSDFQSFPVLLKKIRVFLYIWLLKTGIYPDPNIESVRYNFHF